MVLDSFDYPWGWLLLEKKQENWRDFDVGVKKVIRIKKLENETLRARIK